MTITIYHNPACGTSRTVLAALIEAGVNPKIVEYLKVGWTAPRLTALLAKMGKAPRDLLRVQGTPAQDLGLTATDVSDSALIAAMVAHPILVQRPIVETPKGTALCRPVQIVETLL